MVGVAQLVRASDCGSEGRGFESHHPPQKRKGLSADKPFLFLSIAKAMAYHHDLSCISSPQVYIISHMLYPFRNDDIQCLCIGDIQNFVLMICKAHALILIKFF